MEYGLLNPTACRAHYTDFLQPGRVLLTGHSHQAWPDAARAGHLLAYEHAAAHVDDKWGFAMEAADAVRAAVASGVGVKREQVALAGNTHELLTRFLSALDWSVRRHIVTTDGEFHSLRRQLRRLGEEGVEVTAVSSQPADTLAERLAAAIRPDTAALMSSTVLFQTSTVVPGLSVAVARAQEMGAQVMLDAYHAFGVFPFRLSDYGSGPIFLVGGGYKYLQWGEGACFMVVPEECELRPVYTGWFSDFAALSDARADGPVTYGNTPADRFAGSTYDPTSHYRARAVIEHFAREGWTVEALRELNLLQTGMLIDGFDGYEVLTPREESRRGGFVAVRLDDASGLCTRLRERGIFTDSRGDILRFGPAPYVTEDELGQAIAALREIAPHA